MVPIAEQPQGAAPTIGPRRAEPSSVEADPCVCPVTSLLPRLTLKACGRGRVCKFALQPVGREGGELLLPEACGCAIRMAYDGVQVLRICPRLPKFVLAYVAAVGCEHVGV